MPRKKILANCKSVKKADSVVKNWNDRNELSKEMRSYYCRLWQTMEYLGFDITHWGFIQGNSVQMAINRYIEARSAVYGKERVE